MVLYIALLQALHLKLVSRTAKTAARNFDDIILVITHGSTLSVIYQVFFKSRSLIAYLLFILSPCFFGRGM